MKRSLVLLLGCASPGALAGCLQSDTDPAPSPPVVATASADSPRESSRTVLKPTATNAKAPEISWDTDRDRTFAEFLRDKSGGMIRKAAVGIERRGELRIELDRSVAPEDTLEMTKSIMTGARRDFPDRPIFLSVYDPSGAPILKARYRPEQGVQYKIAHEGEASPPVAKERQAEQGRDAALDPLAHSGVTEADRKFAAWAEEHGRSYLRYVEADLERHGRLWFGVTRDVKPADVPELTKSLLQGAQKEFPRRELVATVFDPEGERIGKAHLGADGQVRWEK